MAPRLRIAAKYYAARTEVLIPSGAKLCKDLCVAGNNKIRVGLIADTHGLLRPEAMEFLRSSDYIVHAGDIGDRGILDELEAIARVCVVRGNNDTEPWAAALRETELLAVGALAVYVIHDLADLRIQPETAAVQVVVSGHSHNRGSSGATVFCSSIRGARDRAVLSCRLRSGNSSLKGPRSPRASSILPTHGCWRAFRRFARSVTH